MSRPPEPAKAMLEIVVSDGSVSTTRVAVTVAPTAIRPRSHEAVTARFRFVEPARALRGGAGHERQARGEGVGDAGVGCHGRPVVDDDEAELQRFAGHRVRRDQFLGDGDVGLGDGLDRGGRRVVGLIGVVDVRRHRRDVGERSGWQRVGNLEHQLEQQGVAGREVADGARHRAGAGAAGRQRDDVVPSGIGLGEHHTGRVGRSFVDDREGVGDGVAEQHALGGGASW